MLKLGKCSADAQLHNCAKDIKQRFHHFFIK